MASSARAVATSSAADELKPAPRGTVPRNTTSTPDLDTAALRQLVHHAQHVGQPPGVRVVDGLVEVDLSSLAEVGGDDANLPIGAPPGHHLDVPIDGRGQHEAVVVVGVLADQIDPPRRPRHHRAGRVAEMFSEQ